MSYKLIATTASVLCALAVSPAWAVNKCTGPDGTVTYQEASCTASVKEEAVKLSGRPLADYELREREALGKARLACGTKDIPRIPQIGWDEERFLKCSQIGVLERPSAVNVTETAGAISKQYVFRYAGAYVYTRNGVVTTVQSSR